MIKLKSHIISEDVTKIIEDLSIELKEKGIRYLNKIVNRENNIQVCCPYHNEGKEENPSAGILVNNYGKYEAGTFHCFACHKVVSLPVLISHLFGREDGGRYGEEWLLQKYNPYLSLSREDELINTLPNLFQTLTEGFCCTEFDEKEYNKLDEYRYIHPYMYQRHLTDDIIEQFDVGYDKETDCITFPCYDENNNFRFVVRRSVKGKFYNLPSNLSKPVYGLNMITPGTNTIYICESIINALTLWSWGYKAVALLGTGSSKQYDILNSFKTRRYILCFDGDDAGDRAIVRFRQNIKSKLIEQISIPRGKDVNDLTQEQFEKLERRGI